MQKNVASIIIVRSNVPALSSMGVKSCAMVVATLRKYYTHVSSANVSTESDLAAVVALKPDLVFLGIKRVLADDEYLPPLWAAAYLDAHKQNYTGSQAAAIRLDFDKPLAKDTVKIAGLRTADYFTARTNEFKNAGGLPLPFPLFIKPANTGGGKGIDAASVARKFDDFSAKVSAVELTFQTPALVETYLPGREFSVAILESPDNNELHAMPIELITDRNKYGDRILGRSVKSADTERAVAVPQGSIRESVIQLAEQAFKALGARDYGRIDVRLDTSGIPHFLEANLIPGVALHDFTSYFTSAVSIDASMGYDEMLLTIVRTALTRTLETEQAVEHPTTNNLTLITI